MNILMITHSWLNQPVFFIPLAVMLMLATTGRVVAESSKPDVNGKTPRTVIEQSMKTLLSQLGAEGQPSSGDPAKTVALVSDVVLPHLDMTRLARMVLGKSWRNADKTQFQRFAGAFETLLIRTYATSLVQYAGEDIRFSVREKAVSAAKAAVQLGIQGPDHAVVELEFRLHNKLGPWLVYDIKIEGVSLVANYRAEYGNIVRNKGLEALIALLESKNQSTRVASTSR